MAEIIISSGKKRRKLKAPRVDLTPMVDLGFLLITFFMFTTTLAQNRTMELNMPYKNDDPVPPQQIPEESTITLIPEANHKIFYYTGKIKQPVSIKSDNISGIRKVLSAMNTKVPNFPSSMTKEAHKLHVIIKPSSQSTYEDLVNVLDEMLIVNIGYYVIEDLTPEEILLVNQEKNN